MNDPKQRFDNSNSDEVDPWRELASAINESRPLVIAAVGQPKTPDIAPVPVSTITGEGPRNLGDLENVIVVTAYEKVTNQDGTRGKPKLWSFANFLKENEKGKIVHVAAPGLLILSTIPNSGPGDSAPYGRASGTSQATAFVAGVVSAMVDRWPRYYTDAALVKTRLQLTSDPFIKSMDSGKLAAGIVDYNLAMHDQQKNWFKAIGEDRFSEVGQPRWLVNEIQLFNSLNQPLPGGPIKTKKIYRIMYRDDNCYIFTSSIKSGEILKFGPGRLKASDLTTLKLFEMRRTPDGPIVPFTLSDISDLLLASPQ